MLISLNISNNKISDLSVLENFFNLESLFAESNEISFINSLIKCKKIKTLHLAHNKINYETSTYKTLENLEKLKDLTMVDNPVRLSLI
jgi:Leucine-rich repeat (LRR) protein